MIASAFLDEFGARMNSAGFPHTKFLVGCIEDTNVELVDAREGLSEPDLATSKERLLNGQNAEHSCWLMDSDFIHHGVNIAQP